MFVTNKEKGVPCNQHPRQSKGVFQIPLSILSGLLITVTILNCLTLIEIAESVNPVLDINGTFPFLINNLTNSIIEPRDYMDFENIYTPNDTYKLEQTAQGRNYHLIKAFDFANYYRSDYWHYSNRDDLIRSAEPVANSQQCAQQLDWVEQQLNRSDGEPLFYPGQQHINLMTLIDSFGRPETSTYQGHNSWFGSYHECKSASIDTRKYQLEECHKETVESGSSNKEECQLLERNSGSDQTINQLMKFRYCVGKASDKDWPKNDNYVPRISYKIGLCLPETCETLTFEKRANQIERLMLFNLPNYTRNRIRLHGIYCLPDDRSPIRQLPLSSRVFLGLCFGWLTMCLMATIFFSLYKRHQRDLQEIFLDDRKRTCSDNGVVLANLDNFDSTTNSDRDGQQISMQNFSNFTNGLSNSRHPFQEIPVDESTGNQVPFDEDQTTAETGPLEDVSANRLNEFQNKKLKSLTSLSEKMFETTWFVKVLKALSIKETLKEFQKPPRPHSIITGGIKEIRVNLNALDSIKCLCCILVIFGHIIFIHMQHLANIVHTIELSYEIYPRLLIAFFNFVDTFFIISGMLTAYFLFKRFNKKSFSNPLVWVYISLLRLLRLSPVYILVLWYIKTTSVYLTHGPIWDYGTDKDSIKGLCINDHWWKSILYFGNAGTMQPLCILPAWSIIVDAQYSLAIPVVILLIFKDKRVGYLMLLLATIVSTAKMTHQLANQTAVKTNDMAKVRLHVYPLISRFAAEFYNTAWNRIGPVAIGMLGGHLLYLYEVGSIRRWPRLMHGVVFKLVLLLHVLIFLLPTIGLFVDDPKSATETDTTIFILSNATIKPLWSIINTILLLRLLTDLRNHSVLARLMSHNIWHSLGKLCFTSYLIHYEIILTFLKARHEGLIDPNWANVWREFSAVFLISTLLSYIIYILYEAPMNKLIMLAFSRQIDRYRKGELVDVRSGSHKHVVSNTTATSHNACNQALVGPRS